MKQTEILRWWCKNVCFYISKKNDAPYYRTHRPLYRVDLPQIGPTYKEQVVNPRHQSPQGQPLTRPETPLNVILVGNVNPIPWVYMATNSIRSSERRSGARSIPGWRVFVDILVYKQWILYILMSTRTMKCHNVTFNSRTEHTPGPRLNIKTVLSTYGDFHVKDKTAVRTSYL